MISSILKRGQEFEFTLIDDPDPEAPTVFYLKRALHAREALWHAEYMAVLRGETDAKTAQEKADKRADLDVNYILEHLSAMGNVNEAGDRIEDKKQLSTLLRDHLDTDQLDKLVTIIHHGPGKWDRLALEAKAIRERAGKNG